MKTYLDRINDKIDLLVVGATEVDGDELEYIVGKLEGIAETLIEFEHTNGFKDFDEPLGYIEQVVREIRGDK